MKSKLKVDVKVQDGHPGSTGFHWLRRLACVEYVTSERGISIRDMIRNPMYGDQISVVTLERWCAEDQWVKQREEYFEKLKDDLKKKIGSSIVQTRMKQLNEIQVMREEIRERLKPLFDDEGNLVLAGPKMNSYEGMVTAYTRLMEMEIKLQDMIAEKVVPERFGGTRNDGVRAMPQLDRTDVRAAAKAIIHKRREESRAARLREETKESGGKPKLRMVKGDDHG